MLVKVNHAKPGNKLIEDVHTSLGGTLFRKGKVLTERDLQILKSFLIEEVQLDDQAHPTPSAKSEIASSPSTSPAHQDIPSYESCYNQVFKSVKKIFKGIKSGSALSIYDLRNALEPLISYVHPEYLFHYRQHRSVEDYLYHHSIYVGMFSYYLARCINIPSKELIQILLAGTLHDIGKLKIDDHLLNKDGPLSQTELEEVRKHTIIGYNLLKSTVGINDGVPLAALQHHERDDGTGYPLQFPGSKIHRYAKIVAIADIFHAMSTNKPYKHAVSPYLVMEQIISDSFGQLDPEMVRIFVGQLSKIPLGSLVRLNDHRIGVVVFQDPLHPTRPIVNVNGNMIHLSKERSYVIEEIIKYG